MHRLLILCGGAAVLASAAACRSPARTPEASPATSARALGSRTTCIDAWLRDHGLNSYGDPPDTMYAGSTPLFDERTGTRVDRTDYVLRKHPEIATACPSSDGR